ncbi:MAG TPA: tripartite tricarboxylate transporter substrate binding protein [Xanthobacteraceae bacterium]|nr:tripartite tricarboxylate transporter substrate binding protein [Xanthobacteraceae bacterium]
MERRKVLQLAAGAAALTLAPRSASALDYPTRPVHVVVGYPPGLSPDIIARLISQAASERLGQQFIVDNRPGAASNIGTEVVAHATPDGYTLLQTVSANAINATLYQHLNFDFARDLTPVAAIGRTPFVIVVNPQFPVKSVPELIAYAKANPGKINIASAGVGTGPHVACELFKMMTGTDMVQVPYKGSYMTDLLGGQVPIAFGPIAQIIEDVRAGKLIAIGLTTATRSAAAPDIPAIAEFVPGYAAAGWYGICATTGTPDDIVEKLNAAISASVNDPGMKAKLLNLGVEPVTMPVKEFKKYVADEIAKYAKVITATGMKAD